LVNYIIGFIMTITVLSVSGNFDEDLAENLGGQPWIAVVYAATRSRTATIIFTALLIVLFFFCTINCITTTSRQLWAFSRDGGLPCSEWLAKVNIQSSSSFPSPSPNHTHNRSIQLTAYP
jgi:amino acid transporter